MKGIVKQIEPRKGWVAIETKEDFAVFELLGGDVVEVDHEIQWDASHPLGHAQVMNLSTGKRFEVYFQEHWISRQNLAEFLAS
jgi:hypothetical protein